MEQSLSYQARREVLQEMAPQYRQASLAKIRTLLDAFVVATGYHRTYARWLLNHAEEVEQTHGRSHLRRYGPEVQHALFLAWHAANRICAKRLIPFLPTLVEALERHKHLHLTEECRRQLLSMSATTADRLLRSQRKGGQHGPSTTRAGTLLKQQIPVSTFEEWGETRPGFLVADLVAHCGPDIEGSYLYTLTLTDIATGWTECLPLMHRSQEAVLAALQRARTLFPFPILGIDTDNGGEFINEVLVAYCAQEHIIFTRGRPYQKTISVLWNRKMERLYARWSGMTAWLANTPTGNSPNSTVRCVYDAAKTPLQRLLLSGILPPQKQQELTKVAQALDPLRLLHQIEQLQQAVFRCAVNCSPVMAPIPSLTIRVFSVDDCTVDILPQERNVPDPTTGLQTLYREQERRKRVLGWRRTHKDPFEGEWEQIFSWLQANPER